MKLSLGLLVSIGVTTSLVNTVACSAKVTVDMGSNDTGGTTSSAATSTGGTLSDAGGSMSGTGGTTSGSTPSTGGASGHASHPYQVIAGDSRIVEIAADSGWVYWSAADSNSSSGQPVTTLSMRSYSAAADAGVVNTSELAKILPSPYPPPQGLKFDGDWMYWLGEAYNPSDISRLYRCRKPECNDVQDLGISGSYAVANGELYWLTSSTNILSCHADNCSATTRTIEVQTAAGQLKFQGASSLAVDGDYLYMARNGGLARVPVAASAPYYEAIAPHDPYDFFIFGDQIYWVEFTNSNAVYSCPKSGCTGDPTPVMKNIDHVQRMAHDDDSIYVVDGSDWQLRRCPITGCDEPEVVLGPESATLSMASDNENIFAVVSGSAYANDYCTGASSCNVILMIPK